MGSSVLRPFSLIPDRDVGVGTRALGSTRFYAALALQVLDEFTSNALVLHSFRFISFCFALAQASVARGDDGKFVLV